MSETLAHMYSSGNTQRELFSIGMIKKNKIQYNGAQKYIAISFAYVKFWYQNPNIYISSLLKAN